jgi:3-deoxy-D-manno-octulosonate 8-phosphate phosphatase KdsC-like HAD superfamily phosphatase
VGARVLYTDIDGTLVGPQGNLLWTSDRTPTLAAAWGLVEAARAGIEVVALSGRARAGVAELARLLGITTFFCELGAVRLYDAGRHEEATPGAWSGPGDAAVALRAAVDGLVGASGGELEEHAPWNAGRVHSLMVRGRLDIATGCAWLAGNGFDWVDLADNGVIPRGFDTLPPDLPAVRVYHLSPAGISKRSGILADQAMRGLDPADCAVVGDARADAECHDVVGRCFLVANGLAADPTLGAVVDGAPNVTVTRRGHTEGFADAVAELLGVAAPGH